MNIFFARQLGVRAFVVLVLLACGGLSLAQRPGDLVVTPTRISLDEKSKSGDITLVNRGSQTMRYRLVLSDMEMSEDGVLHRVSQSEHSAANCLRFSPREIELAPGDSQRIKIAASFSTGGADQELRSHLAFEPIAMPKMLGQSTPSGFGLSFELRSVVSIPVIVRHGHVTATATISSPEFQKDIQGWVLKFRLERTGTRSIRGDVVVTFTPPTGQKQILALTTGLPVYFPNADRIVTMRLGKDPTTLGRGAFQVTFIEPERSRGAASARAEVQLPKQ